MKFAIQNFYKTLLYFAIEKRNIDAIQFVLSMPGIKINEKSISLFVI